MNPKTLNDVDDDDIIMLLDVSGAAMEAGFDFPVKITEAAWDLIEAPDEVVEAWPDQTTDFRLRTFLMIAHTMAWVAPERIQIVDVTVPMAEVPVGEPDNLVHMKTFTLRVVSLGNEGTNIIVMVPDEELAEQLK